MIIGTAGHLDHGKTTLVRALTGIDTDRLPEEKKRGISIELGYAFLPVEGLGEPIGFIDVPGHERLVHTMLSGATGIDHALLLVAADDGPMPQTHEHLAVLALLGIDRGTVLVTKADRVDAPRLRAVEDEARAMLAATPLRDAPVMAVSAATGQGMAPLRSHLVEAARSQPPRADAGAAFRLAIDRVFTLDGVGTVVTGTAHAGSVRTGDELCLCPGQRRVRVRSVHAQSRASDTAHAGQRCALALAGIAKDEVARGQWLVAPLVALSTTRIDVHLALWHGETRPLRSGTPVHVHLGASQVQGSMALLDGDELAPGASALAQLVLHAPSAAWHGERVVLRDASATRTLAGGTVIDPWAPARYRRTPLRLGELAALRQPDAAARLAALLDASPNGVDARRFAAAQGREHVDAPDGALQAGDHRLGAMHAEAARQRLLDALAAHHQREPEELGPEVGRLRRQAMPRLPEALFRALLMQLVGDGRVVQRGAFVHLAEHGVSLSASEERIAQKVAPMLADAAFEGAWARDLARDADESEPLLRTTMARLAQRGEVHQVVRDLYYPPQTVHRLAALAREVAAANDGVVTAARFRDATGLGRKRAIQILEHFDRIGFTRRVGDQHRLRIDSGLFADARVEHERA